MRALLLILCFIPGLLYAQQEKPVEKILSSGFGYNATDPAADKWIDKPIPDFKLTSPEGEVFTPQSLRGKVVVLDFWASWCGWCKYMTHDIDSVLRKYSRKKVMLLGVGYKENNQEKGLKYWKDSHYSFPMTLDNPLPGKELNASHPSVCIIDQGGRIRMYTLGYSPEKITELDLMIGYLLGELKISATEARRSLEAKAYMKAAMIVDLLIQENPEQEKSLWSMRLEALRGMKNPNVAAYMDYLKKKYADDAQTRAQIDTVKYTQPLIIQDVNVVDVIDKKISAHQNILILDGVISQISPYAGAGLMGDRIDAKGAYAVPGLIDSHVHLANAFVNKTANILPLMEYLLHHGITSVRDVGGDASVLGELKKKVANGKITGPTIYYSAFMAGPEYFNRGNGGIDSAALKPWNQCLAPGTDLDAAMKAAVACGATGVKLYAAFSPVFLTQVVVAAKRYGLKTWAHAATFSAKPHEVADAGAEVLSHVYLLQWENVKDSLSNDLLGTHLKYQKGIDRAHIDVAAFCESMKKHNAIFDPTICVSYAGEGDWILETLKNVHQQGVKICAGTDLINDINHPYPWLFDELDYYVKRCGFTPIDALQTATINAAEAVGAEQYTGAIQVGKAADMVIVKNNPMADIDALREQLYVVKTGVLVK